MDAPTRDPKHRGFSNRSPKNKPYWKEMMYKKKPEKRKQKPYGVKKVNKMQRVFAKLRQAKTDKFLCKRNRRQEERELQRKTHTEEKLVQSPTCQALNRFERQCKTKVMDKSNFCKIHQFNDCTSGLVRCMGTNKLLKRCIKSVPIDEQYCNYHKNKKE